MLARRHPDVPGQPLSYRLLGWTAGLVTRALRMPVRTTGLEHLPADTGAVVAWHHVSHIDFLIGGLDLHRVVGRSYHPLALRELWDMPGPASWGVKLGHAIPVDRDDPAHRDHALRDAVQAAQDGYLVMVAPEGRIQPAGEVGPFRTGAVRIAQLAGVPIVPHVAWGTQHLVSTEGRSTLRNGWRLPQEIAFGEPMQVDPDGDARELTEQLRDRVVALVAEVRDRYPDPARA